MISPLPLCKDGQKMEESNVSDYLVERDSTPEEMSIDSLEERKTMTKKRKSAMPESAARSREVTSKDRSKIFKKNTQTTKSSQKLDQDSTTNGKNSKPFWNKFTQEASQKCVLPTKTDCVDMDSNLWSSTFKKLAAGSWFSTKMQWTKILPQNLQKTCSL